MTNYKQVLGNGKRERNKKDGNGPLNRQRDYNARLKALGFSRIGWNKWSYSWQGEFPTFTLAPGGLLNGETGLIARLEEIEILFPYGTNPAFIKVRLDDEILEIMRLTEMTDHNDDFPHKLKTPVILCLSNPATHCRIIENYAGYRIDATADRGKSYFHLDTCKTESEAKEYIIEGPEIKF